MKAMDDRNARPQRWSALWWYLWGIIAAGGAVTAIALASSTAHDWRTLAASPAFWLVAGPLVAIAIGPVVPGNARDGGYALVVFVFALLLHVGLSVTVGMCAVTLFARGLLCRHPPHRNLFNAAQHVVTLLASWAVLRAFAIDPTPVHPWWFRTPHIDGTQVAAVALACLTYVAVNSLSVYAAIALLERRSLLRIIRADKRELLVVSVATASLAPLVVVVMVNAWPLLPLFYPVLVSLYYNANVSEAREYDALHDPLTGVGNRGLLHREGSKAVAELTRPEDGLALFVIDLDKFKEVNDTLGHAAGDQLLRVVSERLLAAVRGDDVVARLGGDEFVLLVRNVPDVAVARLTAARVFRRIAGPCVIDGVSVPVVASMGVAVAPMHGREFDTLLRHADRAMYVAKASGCGVAVFDPELDDECARTAVRSTTGTPIRLS